MANTLKGEPNFGQFVRELNSVRDGAPEELRELLNSDLKTMTDSGSTDGMPTKTAEYCKEYLG